MNKSWRSFWLGTGAAILIAFVAAIILNSSEDPSSQKFSTANTRLSQ